MKQANVFAILCLSFAIVAILFSFTSAVTQYSVIKPFVAQIVPAASEVKVTQYSFNPPYDPTTNRYANCTVTVQNVGEANITVTVTVELFNAANPVILIAYGQIQVRIFSRTATLVVVPLAWTGSYSLRDWADGRITVN